MSKQNFGSIRKKPGGNYEARYYLDGVQHSITCGNEAECRRRLKQVADEQGADFSYSADITLAEYLQDWLDLFGKPSLRHSTYVTYENYFIHHIANTSLGDKKLRSITTFDLQRFFNEKAKNGRHDGEPGGLSPKTLRNIRNSLNVVMKDALLNNLIATNPVPGVKLPRDVKKDMRVLTVAEQITLERVVNASYDATAQGIILALYTGIRIGELLALTWENVELDCEYPAIYIKGTLARQPTPGANDTDYSIVEHTRGNKTAITVGEPKTDNSRRKIYLPKKAIAALDRMGRWQDEMIDAHGDDWNPYGFVICSLAGRPVEPRTYADKLDHIVRGIGMRHVNFHALRHTYATRAVEMGMDVATLSRNLGHAQISTTLNMYVDVMDDQKRESRKIFDESEVLLDDANEDDQIDFTASEPPKKQYDSSRRIRKSLDDIEDPRDEVVVTTDRRKRTTARAAETNGGYVDRWVGNGRKTHRNNRHSYDEY